MTAAAYLDFFRGKTVTLMGLGLLGRGVGDAAFLAAHCKKLYVTDMKSAEDLRPSLDALKSYANIEFVLGKHEERLFETVDFVIKGAGVRLDNPFIKRAADKGVPVYMSTALFARFAGIPVIGVTGTRGKTTTTCMIAACLQRAGKRVLLGGNIRGVSTLALLPEAGSYDCAVLELDSWQMQGFDGLRISPNIGVFTNFYPDHMNYYDGDMARYLYDKASIARHQKSGDVFIAPATIVELTEADRAAHQAAGRVVTVADLPADIQLALPGAHNRANAALAYAAAAAFGVDAQTIAAALRAFDGVEGRLQFVGAARGIKFYNDSNATTQEATLAALDALNPARTVLIFGGSDKGLPMDRLTAVIRNQGVRCVLIKGTGSDRILADLPPVTQAGSMREAMAAALALANPGDNLVLSPAFASFGVFKNEYDRSDQYLAAVGELIAAEQPGDAACRP